MNKIKLIAEEDKYRVFIDETEIKAITCVHLGKDEQEATEITITFRCVLNTKEQ